MYNVFFGKQKNLKHCFIVQLLQINEYGLFVLYYFALNTNTVPQKKKKKIINGL